MAFLRSALQLITIVAWALWFGGTIASFVFISYFFSVFPRDLAGQAGSAMFHIFGQYELVLAGVALFASGMLLVTFPSKGYLVILASLVLAGGMAVTFALGFTPRMESLRQEGKQTTAEFKKLHGKSMIAMMSQSVTLLFAGTAIVLTMAPPHPGDVDLDEEDVDADVDLEARKRSGLSQRV